jgi:hypothetical protein
MRRHIRHAGEYTDEKIRALGVDVSERRSIDLHKPIGALYLFAHQVDQSGAAGNVARAGGGGTDSILFGANFFDLKGS